MSQALTDFGIVLIVCLTSPMLRSSARTVSAVIVVAIPAYFFYPHVHDFRHGGLVSFVMLLFTAGTMVYIGVIPLVVQSWASAKPERIQVIRSLFVAVMTLIWIALLLFLPSFPFSIYSGSGTIQSVKWEISS